MVRENVGCPINIRVELEATHVLKIEWKKLSLSYIHLSVISSRNIYTVF